MEKYSDPNEIIEELRARGIDILNITLEDIEKISMADVERIEESIKQMRNYPRCWHPIEESQHVPVQVLEMLRRNKTA